MKKVKRFQECSKIEQLWRYRFYLAIPFMWLWYSVVGFKVGIDDLTDDGDIIPTNETHTIHGKTLWSLLIGIQQSHMNWTYTLEEVMDKMKKY